MSCHFLGYHMVHQQQIISNSFIGYPCCNVSSTKFCVWSPFGSVHHSWKISVYLGALVLRNDKLTRYQYAYNLKVPNVRTAFGRRLFSFAVPFDWNKLPFGIKLIPHEFDYRKTLKTFDFESIFEFVNGA